MSHAKSPKVECLSRLFISFEGIDGAGKSSHIEPLAEALREQGLDVVITREPGGTDLAEKLRALILNDSMDQLTETLLAFAARRDHVQNVIRPALDAGKVVLCDRFTDSTVAYQGFGRGFQDSVEIIGSLEKWVQGQDVRQRLLQPDLTLWFDLDPQIAAKRLAGARAPDRFESQHEEFFGRVRDGYVSRMLGDPDRFHRIEANQPLENVFREVLNTVQGCFDLNSLTQNTARQVERQPA